MGESFENLKVWQKSHELMLFAHREVVPLLPGKEKWDLADQIRRSSKSAGSNLAEGYGRFYWKGRDLSGEAQRLLNGYIITSSARSLEKQNQVLSSTSIKAISLSTSQRFLIPNL